MANQKNDKSSTDPVKPASAAPDPVERQLGNTAADPAAALLEREPTEPVLDPTAPTSDELSSRELAVLQRERELAERESQLMGQPAAERPSFDDLPKVDPATNKPISDMHRFLRENGIPAPQRSYMVTAKGQANDPVIHPERVEANDPSEAIAILVSRRKITDTHRYQFRVQPVAA
jgi:hypothetical protein